DIMADKEGVTLSLEEEEEDADVALAYKTPEKKSLQEIQELDPGDESLRKYKQALLGAIPAAVGKAGGCSRVWAPRLPGSPAGGFGPSGRREPGRARAGSVPWGIPGKGGHIPAGIARGLDRDVFMVGSYAPRAEEYEVVTPAEEAPRGWLARGCYRVRSLVTDDDKTEHLSWEWGLCIKKAWED
ncbi:GDIR1 inhibitor, partial [Sylvietta virens]|nr:GDIR1 inhibitor [Sylvietta virens]